MLKLFVAISFLLLCCVRFSTLLFGHGSFWAKWVYFNGQDLMMILGFSLAAILLNKQRGNKSRPHVSYIWAFVGVLVMFFINDAFFQGNANWIDVCSMGGFVLLFIYKHFKDVRIRKYSQ